MVVKVPGLLCISAATTTFQPLTVVSSPAKNGACLRRRPTVGLGTLDATDREAVSAAVRDCIPLGAVQTGALACAYLP
jgi:hypothetical protein